MFVVVHASMHVHYMFSGKDVFDVCIFFTCSLNFKQHHCIIYSDPVICAWPQFSLCPLAFVATHYGKLGGGAYHVGGSGLICF